MDIAGEGDKFMLYESDNEDFSRMISEDINPSTLLSDLQGVYKDHLLQIENVDEQRDHTYRVNEFRNLVLLFMGLF